MVAELEGAPVAPQAVEMAAAEYFMGGGGPPSQPGLPQQSNQYLAPPAQGQNFPRPQHNSISAPTTQPNSGPNSGPQTPYFPPPPYHQSQQQQQGNPQRPSIAFGPNPQRNSFSHPGQRPDFRHQAFSQNGYPVSNGYTPPRQHMQLAPYNQPPQGYQQGSYRPSQQGQYGPPVATTFPPHLHPYHSNNSSDSLAYSSEPESPSHHKRRHKHKHSTSGSSRPRDRAGSGSKSHATDGFLGAAGGGLIGDLIFPGLGTAGGAVVGYFGGKRYGKSRDEDKELHDAEQRNWERDHHKGQYRDHSSGRHHRDRSGDARDRGYDGRGSKDIGVDNLAYGNDYRAKSHERRRGS